MATPIEIHPVGPAEVPSWRAMRGRLWPDETDDHDEEIARYLAGALLLPAITLIARDDGAEPLGFAEATVRPHADGCESDRVVYLEGWYVEPSARRRGVGAALVRAVEDWGRAQGCREFASDTEVETEVSAAAHRALGLKEVGRVIVFRKDL
ncbi:MAG: GNAT family N-acetyltransferase [Planctomycetota bacterium]